MNLAIRPNDAGDVVIEPLDWLEPDDYALFREVCARARARYNGTAFVMTRDMIQTACQAGESLRFGMVVDAALASATAPARVRIGSEPRDDMARTVLDSSCRDWQPFPYQLEDIDWLAPREHAGLFSDPGTGKTIVALMALPAATARVVICVPAAVKYQWLDEVKLRRPDYRAVVLAGRKSFRWPEPGEIIITNYEILPGHVEVYGDKQVRRRIQKGTVPPCPGPVVLVGDEIHKVRSANTNQFMRWCALRDAIPAGTDRRIWGLTGTELLNRPLELWNVLRALRLDTTAFGDWPRFVYAFGGVRQGKSAAAVGFGFGKYKWPPVEEMVRNLSPDLVARMRSVSRKRMLADVQSQLPAKTYQWVQVDLDKATRIECDRTLAMLKERGIDLADVQQTVDLTALHGTAFDMISRTRAALAVAKISAALKMVEDAEEAGEPLIVSCAHRMPVDAIGARPGWATITGDTPSQVRRQIVNDFAAGKYKGIAGTIPAMGVGLDGMQRRAWRVMEIDLDWVPDMNKQLEARLCRIGQSRGVVVMRLVGDHPLDRRVLELLAEKQMLIEATTERAALKWNGTAAA